MPKEEKEEKEEKGRLYNIIIIIHKIGIYINKCI